MYRTCGAQHGYDAYRIGTTKGNQLFVVPFVLHFKYDLNSVYTSEKREQEKTLTTKASVLSITK